MQYGHSHCGTGERGAVGGDLRGVRAAANPEEAERRGDGGGAAADVRPDQVSVQGAPEPGVHCQQRPGGSDADAQDLPRRPERERLPG